MNGRRSAWVQAVPSRWAEPFGLVAAEAMMQGTAVVASATGGLPEIVEHGHTGFLIPPDDPKALAETIVGLIAGSEKGRKHGRDRSWCGRIPI